MRRQINNLKTILAFASVLLMTSCATGQLYQATNLPFLSADDGRIYVYRKAAAGIGSGIKPYISVDGKTFGRAVSGSYSFIDVPAGNHVFKVEQKLFSPEVEFYLRPGEEKYIRLRIVPGIFKGHIKPRIVDEATGSREIKSTKSIN